MKPQNIHAPCGRQRKSETSTSAHPHRSLCQITLVLLVFLAQFQSVECPFPSSAGLEGRWKLDEGFGTVAADISNNGRHGRVQGPVWSSGNIGSSRLRFDGLDDAVIIHEADDLNFRGGDEITLAAFIQPTNIIPDYLEIVISKGQDNNPRNFMLCVEGFSLGSGKLTFSYWDSSNQRHRFQMDHPLIAANKLYHVAATYTYGHGSTAKLFLNGKSVKASWVEGNGHGQPQSNDKEIQIGAEEGALQDECFNGSIADVRLYSRTLSPGEIQILASQLPLENPIELETGPHLFVDDHLIEECQNVIRRVNPPQRHRNDPVIGGYDEGGGFLNGQFYSRVFYDGSGFRMWYTALGPPGEDPIIPHFTTSTDGENWDAPLDDSHFSGFIGPGIIMENGTYKAISWGEKDPLANRWYGHAFHSSDGFVWTAYSGNPVTLEPYGELWMPYLDEQRNRYGLLHRWNRTFSWRDLAGEAHKLGMTRMYGHTISPDFFNWRDSQVIFYPDAQDQGETQFYSTSNVIRRGDLLLTMLCILRDDLKAPGTPEAVDCPWYNLTADIFGTGYTVLAWSRDGETWQRDRHGDTFFEPDPHPEAWDHAHAWITDITEVRDEVYLYYGGYKYGHKVYCDRSLGLVKTKRDRFVARESGKVSGWIRTPLVIFEAKNLSLNTDAEGGEVKVQILDANGKPIQGFSFDDCQPITADSLDNPVLFRRALQEINTTPVQIEFYLRKARLYAFGLE